MYVVCISVAVEMTAKFSNRHGTNQQRDGQIDGRTDEYDSQPS